jgi:hypothetical protein
VKIQLLEAEIRELQLNDTESVKVLTNRDRSGSLGLSRVDFSLDGAPVPIDFRETVSVHAIMV